MGGTVNVAHKESYLIKLGCDLFKRVMARHKIPPNIIGIKLGTNVALGVASEMKRTGNAQVASMTLIQPGQGWVHGARKHFVERTRNDPNVRKEDKTTEADVQEYLKNDTWDSNTRIADLARDKTIPFYLLCASKDEEAFYTEHEARCLFASAIAKPRGLVFPCEIKSDQNCKLLLVPAVKTSFGLERFLKELRSKRAKTADQLVSELRNLFLSWQT